VRLLATLTAFLLLTLAGCREGAEQKDVLPNVRLGMAPRDVRDRFQPGGEGSWHTALGTGDDTVLEWTAKDATTSPTTQARFEFHLAMLVAIRARMKEATPREQVATTPKTVTLRAPDPEGGTTITVLARDCPTHKDEAESLANKAR
jgi:hypothetical protein